MELRDFVNQVAEFDSFSTRDRICLFAWYLHTNREIEIFDNTVIRDCFRQIDVVPPDISVYLPRMAKRKPPDLVRARGGYKLERSIRQNFDSRYGMAKSVVLITKLLGNLPAKLPDLAERAFLSEAIDCYRVAAYRAAIVMTWNLAFDHLLRSIVREPTRLAAFNAAIPLKYPKRAGYSVSRLEDFEDFKEAETIEVCRTGTIVSKNVVEILREKLKRRNIAAHPSQVVIVQSQADDVITDLVNNVVLALN